MSHCWATSCTPSCKLVRSVNLDKDRRDVDAQLSNGREGRVILECPKVSIVFAAHVRQLNLFIAYQGVGWMADAGQGLAWAYRVPLLTCRGWGRLVGFRQSLFGAGDRHHNAHMRLLLERDRNTKW